jgi:hypothetical protein
MTPMKTSIQGSSSISDQSLGTDPFCLPAHNRCAITRSVRSNAWGAGWLLVGVLLALTSCASKSAPRLQDVSFECCLTVWPTFEAPFECLLQTDSLGLAQLTKFRYSGAGGHSPKRLSRSAVYRVDSSQWTEFLKGMREYDPWAIPTQQPYVTGVDGTMMTIEIRDAKRHHQVQRWAPFGQKSERDFVEFATCIMKLLPDR